jgi:hypothetical protein
VTGIFIAEDHHEVLEGLRIFLERAVGERSQYVSK